MRAASTAILIVLLTAAVALQAQIKGRVMLSDSEPAAYATVMLYADSNTQTTPKAYAISDAKGDFNIKTQPSAGNWIVVRYLGYKEYRQQVPLDGKPLAIKLKKDAQRLDAVTVESTYKSVEVVGDTIRFNAQYYKTGAEDNAAELLNKIPGMEVSDNGEVSYGGQKIDKITIDGRDMFSSGSDGALQTLSADAIQGAEILRNARSNSIIDNFSGRELTTLNLKTDGRTRLNGKLSAMGGLKDKFKSENSLLLIGKKLSLTSILSVNNTGEAVFSINDYIMHIVGLENLLTRSEKGFSFSADELSMLMPPANVYKSRNGVATLSGNWQPTERFKMKGNLIFHGNDLDAESLSEQEFFTLGMVNIHSLTNRNGNRFFSGQLQETWTPRDNIEISNSTRFTRTRIVNDDSLSERGLSYDLTALENSDMHKEGIDEEMVVNVELGDNLLSAHVAYNQSRRNYSYDLFTDRMMLPMAYYTLIDSNYYIDSRRTTRTTSFAPDVSYAMQLGDQFTFSATVGYSYDKSTFSYHPESGDSIHADLTLQSPSIDVELSKDKGLFRFSVGTLIGRTYVNSSIADLDNTYTNDFNPKATLTLAFSSTHRLTLSASRSDNNIELERLLREPMAESYNNIYRGSAITEPFSETRNLSLNYYIFDLFSNTLFYAATGMTDNLFTLKPYTRQDTSIVTQTYYNNDGSLRTTYITSHLSKGLGHWPIDAKLYATLTKNQSQTSVNGMDGDMQSTTCNLSLNFVSRSKKHFNGEIGGNYLTNHNDIETLANLSSDMKQYGGHVAFIVSYPKFNASVRLSVTHMDNGSWTRDFYDLGFRMEYRLNKWRLTLRGSNITHIDNQDWLSVSSTPVYLSTSTYRKVPGYLIAGVAYRF